MTRRFCILCGKTTDELIESICVDCYKNEKSILHLPEKLTGEICKHCHARKSHGKWVEPRYDPEDAIVKAAAEALNDSIKTDLGEAEVNTSTGAVKKSSDKLFIVPFEVTVRGTKDGVELESTGSTSANIRVGICDDCTRMRGGYFEAVLQVRGEDGLNKEVKKNVSELIADSLGSSYGKRAFVSKVEELKEGVDFYFGSAKLARKVSKVFKDKFGATVTESPKLVGRKNGKDLYRSNIAVRIPKRIIK